MAHWYDEEKAALLSLTQDREWIRSLLRRAKEGDHGAATLALRIFNGCYVFTVPLPVEIHSYIATALTKIADGSDAHEVLHIPEPGNRPKDPDLWERKLTLNRLVIDCIANDPSLSATKAINKVASDMGCSATTVKDARKDVARRRLAGATPESLTFSNILKATRNLGSKDAWKTWASSPLVPSTDK